MFLFGDADIKYKNIRLRSARVSVDLDSAILEATGMPDSTGEITGLPILNDGGEEYKGFKLAYNFRTKKGRITQATTKMENAFYYGDKIKKVDDDILFVEHGRYTTCDLPEPHFHIEGKEMKIILNSQVIARPVILYIADVPVLALPFGVFPAKSGRRSGFIPPIYGRNRNGLYLRRFGYYWAINDYMDLSTTADWYARGGWRVNGNFRYALRYKFRGAIGFSFANFYTGEPEDPDRTISREWMLNISHNQTLNPTSRIDININLSTRNYFRATGTTVDDFLRQNMISNASYYKTFEKINGSLSIRATRNQSLVTGEVDETLPEISFTLPQIFPFGNRGALGRERARWFELISFSYSARFLNRRNTNFSKQFKYGIAHNLNINFTPRIKYFNIVPFFTYTEKWYDRRMIKYYDSELKKVISKDEHGFFQSRYFNFGISVSTKLYGIMQLGIAGIQAFRHTLMPNISLVYQPDFSEPFWRNYGSYIDSTGKIVKYNYFEDGVFGGAPVGRARRLNVSVGNIFEIKTIEVDTTGEAKKYQLLNLNISLSYNFAAQRRKLSPLSLTARTNIGKNFDIFASSTFDFYKYGTDEFLIRYGGIAWMRSFTLSMTLKFSGRKKGGTNRMQGIEEPSKQFYQIYDIEKPDMDIPWNLSLGFNYSISRFRPDFTKRSASVRFNLSFDLTRNWKIVASGVYDFISSRILAPYVSVYRDLHCWEMLFTWYPSGLARGFTLEIRVKAPQLRDLRITKRRTSIGR
jgi:lipopolysaccharide assembly outer membrane protein LptD (OstA)